VSDRTFKLILVLFAGLLVLIAYFASQNGRYQYMNDASGLVVFDTRNGTLRHWGDKGGVFMNLVSGERGRIGPEQKDEKSNNVTEETPPKRDSNAAESRGFRTIEQIENSFRAIPRNAAPTTEEDTRNSDTNADKK
jgi:hypothetical protein